jgi:hypothetical protein
MRGFDQARASYDAMLPDDVPEFDEDGRIEAGIRKDLKIVLRQAPDETWAWEMHDEDTVIDGGNDCDSIGEAAGDAEREMEKWVAVQLENAADADSMKGGC